MDAGPDTSRLFWCGPTLDPATGDRVPLGVGDLSNMHLAEAIAAERPDTVLLESTTDGGTIERMQLWSDISPDHIRALRSEDPELDAKISAFEAELPGDGYAFQRVVWSSMAAQYARDAAAAMAANPELETGVITQQPWPTTDFYAVEYQQMAAHSSQIWYPPQVRTPGPDGVFDPTPGPVDDQEMNAAGRGMGNMPPPRNPYPTLSGRSDLDLDRMRSALDGSAAAYGAVAAGPVPGDGSRRAGHSIPPRDRTVGPGLDH